MDESRLELLQGMPIFGAIRRDALAGLVEAAEIVLVPRGEFFFHEGDREASAFVLERGRVSILKTVAGREFLLRELGDGDCFGEVALIDFGARSASVVAQTDCSAIKVTAAGLRRALAQDLEQFALVYMNMARELARRLRTADDRIFEAKVEARLVDGDYRYQSV
jgi:CRP-like cAMP-binding protein